MPAQPRASAPQAIEALKFHQLRRENQIIFTEMKSLRQEVAELKHGLPQLRENAIVADRQLKTLQTEVTVVATKVSCLETGQEANKLTTHAIQERHADHETSCAANMARLEADLETLKTGFGRDCGAMALDLDRVDVQLNNHVELLRTFTEALSEKVDVSVILALERRVDEFIDNIALELERSRKAKESIVLETPSEQLRQVTSNSSSVAVDGSENSMWRPITIPQDEDDDMILKNTQVDRCERRHELEVPSLFSTPENVTFTSYQSAGKLRTSSVMGRLHTINTISSQAPGLDLRAILQLRQSSQEDIAAYFNRNVELLDSVSLHPEALKICLRRFVTGLPDREIADYILAWLDTSSWTLKEVKDCLTLVTIAHMRSGKSYKNTVRQPSCKAKTFAELPSGRDSAIYASLPGYESSSARGFATRCQRQATEPQESQRAHYVSCVTPKRHRSKRRLFDDHHQGESSEAVLVDTDEDVHEQTPPQQFVTVARAPRAKEKEQTRQEVFLKRVPQEHRRVVSVEMPSSPPFTSAQPPRRTVTMKYKPTLKDQGSMSEVQRRTSKRLLLKKNSHAQPRGKL